MVANGTPGFMSHHRDPMLLISPPTISCRRTRNAATTRWSVWLPNEIRKKNLDLDEKVRSIRLVVDRRRRIGYVMADIRHLAHHLSDLVPNDRDRCRGARVVKAQGQGSPPVPGTFNSRHLAKLRSQVAQVRGRLGVFGAWNGRIDLRVQVRYARSQGRTEFARAAAFTTVLLGDIRKR